MIFGKNRDKGIRRKSDGDIEVVQLGNGITESDLIVHDAHHPLPSYALPTLHMEGRQISPRPSASSAPGATSPATKMS